MNVLDEDFPDHEAKKMNEWRVHTRQIGVNIGRKGMQDAEIISMLHGMPRPTFFTRDEDFYRERLRHRRYALVWLDVRKSEAGEYCLRLLRHPAFDTKAKRMGCVIRVAAAAIHVWNPKESTETQLDW